ncbi:unnamed protein product [Nesidiocoris tenuis]|uniref:Uncharacterized protein n=1 Tax=Nesidiocoris tenuis TaxID=355587 RepID=A0A6H5FYK3_9HEMI|nr:unnamed protein product [Nesidiocoris tenuis]
MIPLDEERANPPGELITAEGTNPYAAQTQEEQAKFPGAETTFFPMDDSTLPPLAAPRKRTLKRRRKPSRKYQGDGGVQQEPTNQQQEVDETSPKPLRRRRKGGRRRMRPRPEATETPKFEAEATVTPSDLEYTTIFYESSKAVETLPDKVADEEKQDNHIPVYSNRAPEHEKVAVTQPPVTVIESLNTVTSKATSRVRPYSSSKPSVNTYKPVREFVLEPADGVRFEPDSETNEVPSQAPTEPTSTNFDYGSKVFDRKVLFSKSRKLPVTSAIIRKKLTPRQRAEAKPSTPPENQQTEASSRYELHKLLPEGYTVQPQVMEPAKLLERLKEHSSTYRTTTFRPSTEEQNYPKFESRRKLKMPTFRTTTEAVVETTRAEKSTFKYDSSSEQTTIIEHNSIVEEITEAQLTTQKASITTTTTTLNSQGSEPNSNVSNDSIVDLLKAEGSSEKLTRILEARNMTVAQLLEHRQRGSSKFHLADIFASRKSISGKNTTESMSLDQEELGTPLYPEKQTILFPSEEVLGLFPAFVSNKIESAKKEVAPGASESREPRVFSSMPEFANTRKEDDKLPPWKVPNPKLRPVSVRGDIEEIKISLKPTRFANVDDEKIDVLRTNRVASTLEADPITAENSLNRFRRIPVTVKSAIIISTAILILAIFGFLSVLVSCRMRQKRERLRAKQDILCEHLKSEDFMNSQQSLSPVLTKHQGRGAVFAQQNTIQSNTTSNRHYYLWQTLRKTLQHD